MEKTPTRAVRIGKVELGAGSPVIVQSMCATKTTDIDATVAQVHQLQEAGAGVVRIAVDNPKEAAALKEIRAQTTATLSVDLQENYKVAATVAAYVDKVRYNPGHLHHIEKAKSIPQKVAWLVGIARDTDVALRIGVNCGSVAPAFLAQYPGDQMEALLQSTLYHCRLMVEGALQRARSQQTLLCDSQEGSLQLDATPLLQRTSQNLTVHHCCQCD